MPRFFPTAPQRPDWMRRPTARRLRVYAFDPRASSMLDTAVMNDTVIELPWETPWEDEISLGPTNDYLEVVDIDPACGLFYAPLDLNDPYLLAQDGLPPEEGRPQFHQQMVFAVAMKTIRSFERALGRTILWAAPPHKGDDGTGYTRRLRIYPHALREPNAYYSPDKGALLFGYFKPDRTPGGEQAEWVFTCLSQDIIAHETTHAILHGLQPRTIDASNPDMLAFHEGFADIVALLQHFTMTDVLEHQIESSAGSLRINNLMTGLAAQFGVATGRNGALRYALAMIKKEGEIQQGQATSATVTPVSKLEETTEPHARGQFLVAAIFDAFVAIYERRTGDLFRLARYSGTLGDNMPPELVKRLAKEAGKAAEQVMRMCVRAIDYLPPVDFTFGEYLRALITADTDLVPNDPLRYRVAIAEGFRKRGIQVPGCISYAPESLMWDEPDVEEIDALKSADDMSGLFADVLGKLKFTVGFGRTSGNSDYNSGSETAVASRNLRKMTAEVVQYNQLEIWKWLEMPSTPRNGKTSKQIDRAWERLLGVRMLSCDLGSVRHSRSAWKHGKGKVSPAVEVHSARVARRQGPDGQELHQLIVQVTQARFGLYDESEQKVLDDGPMHAEPPKGDFFVFRGGATIIVDLRDGRVRRVVRKRIDDDERLQRQRAFLVGDPVGMAVAGKGSGRGVEPFALVHRC